MAQATNTHWIDSGEIVIMQDDELLALSLSTTIFSLGSITGR